MYKVQEKVQRYRLLGLPFQCMLVFSILYQTSITNWSTAIETDPLFLWVVRFFGFYVTMHYMARIYLRKEHTLMTDGLFRFSRHPMYIGFALLAVDAWWPRESDLGIDYYMSLILFCIGIIIAGYLQEKETIASYGQEAINYYKRTPRLLGFPRKG